MDEAHKWGVPIAAHAIGAGGDRSLRPGRDRLDRARGADRRRRRPAMKEPEARSTCRRSTRSRGMVDHPDDVPAYALEKATAVLEIAHDAFRRSVRAGVRLASGPMPARRSTRTAARRSRSFGWSSGAARRCGRLQAATSGGAELLRVPEVGTVEAGKVADLVLYATDPLDDISAFLAPAWSCARWRARPSPLTSYAAVAPRNGITVP